MTSSKFDIKGFSVLSIAHVINDMYANFLPPMLPFLVAAGVMNITKSTSLVAAFTISSSLTQPFFGYLIDQKGKRWLLFVGTLWMAVLLGLLGYTKNYYLLLLLSTLAGMGTSAFHPQAASMVTTMGGKKQGTALSAFIAFGTIGMAIAPLVLMPLLSTYGLGITGYMVIPGVAAAMILYYFAPREQALGGKKIGNLQEVMVALKASYGELLKLMTVVAMRSLVFTGLLSLIPFYLEGQEKITSAESGAIMFIMLAAGAIGGLAGGSFSDKYGRKILIIVSLAASAPLFFGFLILEGLFGYILLALGTGFLMASFSVTVVAAQEIIPGNKALASGLSMGFAIGIGGLAVTFIGSFADIHGVKEALYLLFFLPIGAAITGMFLRK